MWDLKLSDKAVAHFYSCENHSFFYFFEASRRMGDKEKEKNEQKILLTKNISAKELVIGVDLLILRNPGSFA